MGNLVQETIIELGHNQRVKVEGLTVASEILVKTLLGCCHGDIAKAEAIYQRGLENNNGEIRVWTIKNESILCDDYEGKCEKLLRNKLEFESSIMLEDGQVVKCEGRFYKVKIVGKQYSDPIHFQEIERKVIA